MKNRLIDDLINLGISNPNDFEVLHPRTRDIDSLNVLKCKQSGVIVLEEIVTSDEHYRTAKKDGTIISEGRLLKQTLGDNIRRFEQYKDKIIDSDILDFGCGLGGYLNLTKEISRSSTGMELNQGNRETLKKNGIDCFDSFEEINGHTFDLITLNHVFEHLLDPLETLTNLRKLLKDDGLLIIEVPHARDILIESFNIEAFRDFIFWSEHLILHTKESLTKFACHSGLALIKIEGFQRYPISNHYHWLLDGKPGGHEVYSQLNKNSFHENYQDFLAELNQTDTLIGYFGKE
jgi:2-polyprenyl-3-methyl-5-hydroxy-6-metoxy-1,4-benzoquinol methylase